MQRIQVAGTGCAKCAKLAQTVQSIVTEMKLSATVEKVTDLNEIVELGLVATPGLVIDGVVRTAGRVPSEQEIRDWLCPPTAPPLRESAAAGSDESSECCCCGESDAPPVAPVTSCCGSSETSPASESACCSAGESAMADPDVCCGGPPPREVDWSQVPDDAPWVVGMADTSAGPVPRVATTLCWPDRLGAWKARWGMGRMHYWVKPRLYAVGSPNEESAVFVTANYKMTFDRLRASLAGRDAWVLVLDTRGINVWCAAGKGTFGTDELVQRIEVTGLGSIVNHRQLIVPQLGAVGVAAHEVCKRSGFRVTYGPVRAEDLPAFIEAGMKATPEMRRVEFPLRDRLSVAVVELVIASRYVSWVVLALLLLGGLGPDGYSLSRMITAGGMAAAMFLLAFLAGTILGPVLLPWLPGRSFSVKGIWIGLLLAAGLGGLTWAAPERFPTGIGLIAWLVILPVVTSFTVMNYTGSSTYTSLSGVRHEMRRAVPLQAVGSLLGGILWLAGRFV